MKDLFCVLKLYVDLYRRVQVCHVGGQSTSAKHASGEFYATECNLRSVPCSWPCYTLADCRDVVRVKYLDVHFSRHAFLVMCVIARDKH